MTSRSSFETQCETVAQARTSEHYAKSPISASFARSYHEHWKHWLSARARLGSVTLYLYAVRSMSGGYRVSYISSILLVFLHPFVEAYDYEEPLSGSRYYTCGSHCCCQGYEITCLVEMICNIC